MPARRGSPANDRPLGESRWVGLDRHGWAIALVLCLPALIPLLLPGWFEGHDDLHIYRQIEYDAALRDGQIPPRWYPDISAGYGNPHPIYYAPLFYMVAEVFHCVGLGIVGSLKGALVLIMLLSAVAMFHYARVLVAPPAALVAATAYTYAPYHLLDVYVRKAFSEFTVFAFLPLLLLSLHRLRRAPSRSGVIWASLAMAATFLSHTVSNMMLPPLLGAYALMLCRDRSSGRWSFRWLGSAALAGVAGFALAGFFLVPAFLERNAINLSIYTEAYVAYQKHFVYPQQLIWWPWGFGMSLEGLKDKMSFRMGLGQIAGAILATAGVGVMRRRAPALAYHAYFFLAVTVAAAFMMLPISAAVWAALPALKYVQFPWRFLTLTTLSTAFLCGLAFAAFGPAPASGTSAAARRRSWVAAGIVAAAFAAAAALGGTLGVNLRVPVARVGFEEKPYNNMIDRGEGAAPEAFDREFVRRHTLRWIDHLPPRVAFMGLTQADVDRPKVEVARGSARIEDLTMRTSATAVRVEAASEARIRVNCYAFPGWIVRVDGHEAPIVAEPGQRPLIFFDVGPGPHRVLVAFETTPARRLGDRITLAGLALVAAIGLWPVRAPRTMDARKEAPSR